MALFIEKISLSIFAFITKEIVFTVWNVLSFLKNVVFAVWNQEVRTSFDKIVDIERIFICICHQRNFIFMASRWITWALITPNRAPILIILILTRSVEYLLAYWKTPCFRLIDGILWALALSYFCLLSTDALIGLEVKKAFIYLVLFWNATILDVFQWWINCFFNPTLRFPSALWGSVVSLSVRNL